MSDRELVAQAICDAALSAAGRLRAEVAGEVVEVCLACRGRTVAINGKAHCLPCRQSYRPVPEMAGIVFDPPDPIVGIIAADAEQRVRAGLAKQMREDAEANRKLGNVDAAGIFDDIAKDLEAPHVG